MAARSFASVTIAFGLVSIPVDVFSAEISASRLSFNLLHFDRTYLLGPSKYGAKAYALLNEAMRQARVRPGAPCRLARN